MRLLFAVLLTPALCVHGASTETQIRTAAAKSVQILQSAMTGFHKAQDCFSCHHSGLPTTALKIARERGVPVDEAAARVALTKAFTKGIDLTSIDRMVQANAIIDPASSDGAGLIAAHDAGLKPTLTTAILARLIANAQRSDGHWLTLDQRPPQGHSQFSCTAIALRAIQLYLPEELTKEKLKTIARAKAWFLKAKPATTEDATYRLFGLAWAGATVAEKSSAVNELRALQRANGGWAQLPRMQSDAYATGEALVALHEAGAIPVTDPSWRKGLEYLMSTQQSDGSWHVKTRMVSPAAVSPPYFETGFPYGHDQFLSSAATAFAAQALMLTLPKVANPAPDPGLPDIVAKQEKPWMRTAIFGKADALKSLLDGGLDPNSRTEAGTTLLMMATPDVEKMRLLIERGADVNAKAKSGYTAVMTSSLYRGSADALRLLFSKGASARFGPGVLFNASPLVLAAYSGDREVISLLLANGADIKRKMLILGIFPASPLAQSTFMGEVEVMKTLIAAGADTREHDPDGLSLLHSAALANHPEAAQLLIDSGASINDVDKHGYTPLLYASTVDFGDDSMVKLLLKAGADPSVRSKSGDTALLQAKRQGYPHIQAALEKAAK